MLGIDTRTARDLADAYAEPRPSFPRYFTLNRVGTTSFSRGLPIEGVDLVMSDEHDGTDVRITVRFGRGASEGMHGMSEIIVTDDSQIEWAVTGMRGH